MHTDPLGIQAAFTALQKAWLKHPSALSNAYLSFSKDWMSVLHLFWQRWTHPDEARPQPTETTDERFQDPIWSQQFLFDLTKDYYLAWTRIVNHLIEEAPDVSPDTKSKAGFWIRQYLNAMAPSNFWWTNPKVQAKTLESQGQNLQQGLRHFIEDLSTHDLPMVDSTPFQLGVNVANTKGSVVFRNELVELIHYAPVRTHVHQIPLFIVPPWINKYYILDLNPGKSLIRFLVEQGFNVFCISWNNPDRASPPSWTFEDYLLEGILKSVQVVRTISQSETIHALGYCVGGTALATAMAYLNHPSAKKACPIAHATLLCTLVDFENPGDLGVFTDAQTLDYVDQVMKKGYLDGKEMEIVFRLLRPNSLWWNYYVSRYLLGEKPSSFDVLSWNADGTRLPAPMHRFYLRQFYLHNRLARGELQIKNRTLNLGQITQPFYLVGTENDHITPWQGTFKGAHLLNGPVRYVLAAAGHIVGILSPPGQGSKRSYWASDVEKGETPEHWKQSISKTPGSWWEDWSKWLAPLLGEVIPAPTVGTHPQYPALEDAPGSYVKK